MAQAGPHHHPGMHRQGTQKTDIFLIDVDVEKAANLAGFVAEVRLEVGELVVESREELPEVRGGTRD
jgi:hypothetical protein